MVYDRARIEILLTRLRPSLKPWKNREFRLLVGGQTFGSIGGAIAIFSLPLIAISLSSSIMLTSFVSAALPLGAVSTSLLGGVVADRFRNRLILVLTALGCVLIYASLAATTFLETVTIPELIVCAFFIGTRVSFFVPAEQVAVRAVLPVDRIPLAQSSLQVRGILASVAGGPLGGVLLGIARWSPFFVGSASYFVAFICALKIRSDLSLKHEVNGSNNRSSREGLRWILQNEEILTILASTSLTNFAFCSANFMMIVDLRIHGWSAIEIGIIETAGAFSALLGASFSSRILERFRTGSVILLRLGVSAFALFGLAFSIQIWHFVIVFILLYFTLAIGNVGFIGFLTAKTPDSLQGRVASAVQLLATGVIPLAPIVGGFMLNFFGYTLGCIILALIALASLFLAFTRSSVRSIPLTSEWSDHMSSRLTG